MDKVAREKRNLSFDKTEHVKEDKVIIGNKVVIKQRTYTVTEVTDTKVTSPLGLQFNSIQFNLFSTHSFSE